ncbi:MAG TPA: hypothetical protein ENH10_00250, partial [Bacteroidetes bacterium]|nr:hypothetical protein [Bacteroidota bacterium]HEX03576.1 hypothetical protein [Bacteroidota bacterium]
MKILRISAWISTIAAFLLIFSREMIEPGNHIPGIALGLLVLITTILALKDAHGFPKVWIPVLVSNLLIAGIIFQGTLGDLNGLERMLSPIQLMLPLMTASLLLYASMELRFIRHPYAERKPQYPSKLRGWLIFIFILVLLQIVLGNLFSGSLGLVDESPPTYGYSGWTYGGNPLAIVHQILGILIALISMQKAAVLIKLAERPTPLVYNAASVGGGSAIGMLLIGAAMFPFHHISALKMIHMRLAILLLGALLIMLMSVKYNFLPSIATYKPERRR